MKDFLENTKLLLKVSRPAGWGFIPIVILAGITFYTNKVPALAIVQMLYFSIPYSIFLYGINDINDYESDVKNPNKNSIYGAMVSKEDFLLIRKWVNFTGIGTVLVSMLTMNFYNITASLLVVAFGYYYSVNPVRIKTKPPWDSISNAFLYILFPFAIGQSYTNYPLAIPREIVFLSIVIIGLHAVGSLRDYAYDKKVGDETFATKYGKRISASIFPLGITATLVWGDIDSVIVKIFLMVMLGLGIFTIVFPNEKIIRNVGKVVPYLFYSTASLYFLLKLI